MMYNLFVLYAVLWVFCLLVNKLKKLKFTYRTPTSGVKLTRIFQSCALVVFLTPQSTECTDNQTQKSWSFLRHKVLTVQSVDN